MQYEVEISGRARQVAISRSGEGFNVTIDGRSFEVSAARIDAQTLSLIIRRDSRGADANPRRSFEVSIAPDPASGQLAVHVGDRTMLVALNGRRRPAEQSLPGARGRGGTRGEAAPPDAIGLGPGSSKKTGAPAATGSQRIVAPMPGKIVRVLVRSGEVVGPRQPLVVVEAMKMENELRAGRGGTVAEVHAHEGLSVEAGALLVIIQ